MLIAMWFVFFFPLFAFSVNILALVVRRSRKRISHDLHEMINCTRHGTIFIALVSFTWHHHHHYHHQFEWHANNEMELNRTHLMTNRRARPHLSSAPPPHLSHSESEIFVKFLNSSKGKVFVFQVWDCALISIRYPHVGMSIALPKCACLSRAKFCVHNFVHSIWLFINKI